MFYLVFMILLLIGGALTALVIENLSNPLQMTFFIWSTPQLPIGLWVVAAFLLGALLLYLVSMLSALHDRYEMKRLRRRIGDLELRIAVAESRVGPLAVEQLPLDQQKPRTAPLPAGRLSMPGFRS